MSVNWKARRERARVKLEATIIEGRASTSDHCARCGHGVDVHRVDHDQGHRACEAQLSYLKKGETWRGLCTCEELVAPHSVCDCGHEFRDHSDLDPRPCPECSCDGFTMDTTGGPFERAP